MRVKVRILLLASAVACTLALSASAAYASFGHRKVRRGQLQGRNLRPEARRRSARSPPPNRRKPTRQKQKNEGFTQAGGRVPFGITDFKVKTTGSLPTEMPEGEPVTHIRTDVAPGLATNPTAVPQCPRSRSSGRQKLAKGMVFAAPHVLGSNRNRQQQSHRLRGRLGTTFRSKARSTTSNPNAGHASEFGVAVSLAPLGLTWCLFAHTLIKGNVEWGKGSALAPNTSELGRKAATTTTTSKSKSRRHCR